MSNNSERVKMCFPEDWFNQLMGVLDQLIDHYKFLIEEERDEDLYKYLVQNHVTLCNLKNKIIQYGQFEPSERANLVRVGFFSSEAEDLIWYLLEYSLMANCFSNEDYYTECESLHNAYKEKAREKKRLLEEETY